VKLPELSTLPTELTTVIGPVVAPVGTVAVIFVLEFTAKLAATPAKLTPVVPVKLLPVMVTRVPAGPLVGEKEVIEGATITTKLEELAPVSCRHGARSRTRIGAVRARKTRWSQDGPAC
jgi:hypothetical protein